MLIKQLFIVFKEVDKIKVVIINNCKREKYEKSVVNDEEMQEMIIRLLEKMGLKSGAIGKIVIFILSTSLKF